jgi:hypothetical protein
MITRANNARLLEGDVELEAMGSQRLEIRTSAKEYL